tara:strand:- start:42 stop:524 length:483 start_codon:yes stop_codon:yes gene_type:complete
MKKKYTLILIGLLLSCSNNDDDGIDCSLFDPAFPELYIRLVDETGTNLIDNGTIDPDNITIEGNFSNADFRFIPANEFANPDAEIREFDNTLLLYIPNESTFRYTVNLDDTDSVDIDFTAELTRIPCNISYFIPNGVEYNNVTLELTEVSSLQFLAVIEL